MGKQDESRPSVKPAEDAAAPSSIPNTVGDSQVIEPLGKGWGFFAYVALFVVIVIGGLLSWWVCLGRVVKRIVARRKGKSQYRRVADEEK